MNSSKLQRQLALKEILEEQYKVSKNDCMVYPHADIVRIENISHQDYEVDEGLIYNKELGIYEDIDYCNYEITLSNNSLSNEELLEKKTI